MNKLVVIIPIIAIGFLVIHAHYGHQIFPFSYEQDINKHSTYIHLQPEWNSYPRNILYDITTVWDNPESGNQSLYYDETIGVQLKTEYNQNELLYLNGKSYVQLDHEFSDCTNIWEPVAYRHTIDTIGHQYENLIGDQKNSDPYIIQYNLKQNQNTREKIVDGYSQFIPICTVSDTTSYDYSIKINDEKIGFDVYFVPNLGQRELFHQDPKSFVYYIECSAHNYQMYSGTCNDVGKNSGLLIILPDKLNLSLTEITVNLHEKLD